MTSTRQNRALWIAMGAVALLSMAAAATGIGVRASYGARVTGDEPYYLITSQSLGRDGNLNIADEISNEEFRDYHEIRLDEQTKPLSGGRRVSPHDPLLPALLVLPMAIGGWVAAKLTLVTVAGALAALLVWIAVRRFGVPPLCAAVTIAIFAMSTPMAVYGNQVYPELPAALCVAVSVAALTARSFSARALGVLCLSVVALVWLSVKFTPVAATLALVGLVKIWRARGVGAAGVFAIALGIAGLLFAAAHLRWYGGLTPYAVGDHFVDGQLDVVGLEPDYAGRARRLVGLLVDRDFGLAAWQPAWLLMIPATVALLRHRPRGWEGIAFPALVGWLTATFVALTMQGWWWPGRQVVVILPCVVLAIVWWAGRASGARLMVAGLGSLGILAYAWVVADGIAGRITWVVDFFDTTNPLYRAWRLVLPNYLDVSSLTWVLHWGWTIGLVAIAILAWRSPVGPARREPAGSSTSRDPNQSTENSVAMPSSKWLSRTPPSSSTMLQKRT